MLAFCLPDRLLAQGRAHTSSDRQVRAGNVQTDDEATSCRGWVVLRYVTVISQTVVVPRNARVPEAPAAVSSDARTEAFEEFVVARSERLLRTAYLLTRDHALAEDLLQTALAKGWSSWHRIEADPESYVRRIIVNTGATWWRRRWNGELPTEELPEPSGRNPHHGPVADVAVSTDLWDAVGRLPKRQRAVIVLRFYEDMSEAATAELLGVSAGTIKSQTSKALAKLRIDPSILEGHGPRSEHEEGST
jgi:RNA polymerase sigma-70 factor (sigma-E family)